MTRPPAHLYNSLYAGNVPSHDQMMYSNLSLYKSHAMCMGQSQRPGGYQTGNMAPVPPPPTIPIDGNYNRSEGQSGKSARVQLRNTVARNLPRFSPGQLHPELLRNSTPYYQNNSEIGTKGRQNNLAANGLHYSPGGMNGGPMCTGHPNGDEFQDEGLAHPLPMGYLNQATFHNQNMTGSPATNQGLSSRSNPYGHYEAAMAMFHQNRTPARQKSAQAMDRLERQAMMVRMSAQTQNNHHAFREYQTAHSNMQYSNPQCMASSNGHSTVNGTRHQNTSKHIPNEIHIHSNKYSQFNVQPTPRSPSDTTHPPPVVTDRFSSTMTGQWVGRDRGKRPTMVCPGAATFNGYRQSPMVSVAPGPATHRPSGYFPHGAGFLRYPGSRVDYARPIPVRQY